MISRIVTMASAIKLSVTFKEHNQKLVVVGGCFDILHYGHLVFLKKAKMKGDVLMVLLESDATVRRLKGSSRPLNIIDHRAKMLASLRMVDIVVKLPTMNSNADYNYLVEKLRPEIIAVTENDSILKIKQQQAERVGGEVFVVTGLIPDKSTTWLQERISKE